jgi:hypothetical protein
LKEIDDNAKQLGGELRNVMTGQSAMAVLAAMKPLQ